MRLCTVHFLVGIRGLEIKRKVSGEIFSSPILTTCTGKLKIVDAAKLFNYYDTV